MSAQRISVLAAIGLLAVVASFSLTSQNAPPRIPSDLDRAVTEKFAGADSAGVSLSPDGALVLSPPRAGLVRGTSRVVDLRALETGPPARRPNLPERGEPVAPQLPTSPTRAGGALGISAAAISAPNPGTVFAGLDYINWGCGYPPDTNGDVGLNDYVQSVNCSLGIWTKSNPSERRAAVTFDALFNGTNSLCDTNNYTDPVVVYDTFADRWIVSDLAFIVGGSGKLTSATFECIAVSKGSDPVTSGWTMYAFPITAVGDLADYPKVGVWPTGIFITFNVYGAQSFKNVRVLAVNRDDLINGVTNARTITYDLPQQSGGITVFSLLPSNARKNTGKPTAGSPNYLASIYGSYAVRVWRFTPNWAAPASSTLTGPVNVSTGTFSVGPSTAPTPANANDTLTYRLMMQNQYTSISGTESLWVTHTVGVSKIAAPAWYQVGLNNGSVLTSLRQKGTYAPGDGVHRYMPSLAVDKQGDLALGYSASKSTMHPQIRYAARLASDSPGALGSEANLYIGTGSQTYTNRWGDYATMSLDPADGCTFWFTSEAYSTTGRDWQTRIGSFRLPACS